MERTWHHPGIPPNLERSHDRVQLLSVVFPKSLGWEHYEVHEPEPHILLFK